MMHSLYFSVILLCAQICDYSKGQELGRQGGFVKPFHALPQPASGVGLKIDADEFSEFGGNIHIPNAYAIGKRTYPFDLDGSLKGGSELLDLGFHQILYNPLALHHSNRLSNQLSSSKGTNTISALPLSRMTPLIVRTPVQDTQRIPPRKANPYNLAAPFLRTHWGGPDWRSHRPIYRNRWPHIPTLPPVIRTRGWKTAGSVADQTGNRAVPEIDTWPTRWRQATPIPFRRTGLPYLAAPRSRTNALMTGDTYSSPTSPPGTKEDRRSSAMAYSSLVPAVSVSKASNGSRLLSTLHQRLADLNAAFGIQDRADAHGETAVNKDAVSKTFESEYLYGSHDSDSDVWRATPAFLFKGVNPPLQARRRVKSHNPYRLPNLSIDASEEVNQWDKSFESGEDERWPKLLKRFSIDGVEMTDQGEPIGRKRASDWFKYARRIRYRERRLV